MTRPNRDPYITRLVQFLSYKQDSEENKRRAEEIKAELNDYVKKNGYTDNRGNVYLELPTPVQVGDQIVRTLKVEKRTSLVLNEDRLLELADQKGVRDRVVTTIEIVDQDEIYTLYAEGVIDEHEFDSIFDKPVSYAFKPLAD